MAFFKKKRPAAAESRNGVSRDEIKAQVLTVLASVALELNPSREDQLLEKDLGVHDALRSALSAPYTEISTKYPGGKPISSRDAEDLEDVKGSIDLVHARANGR